METVHRIARTYGVRPSEVAYGGMHEFNFDAAVMFACQEKDFKMAAALKGLP